MDLRLDLYCRRTRHRLDFDRDPTIPGNILEISIFLNSILTDSDLALFTCTGGKADSEVS